VRPIEDTTPDRAARARAREACLENTPLKPPRESVEVQLCRRIQELEEQSKNQRSYLDSMELSRAWLENQNDRCVREHTGLTQAGFRTFMKTMEAMDMAAAMRPTKW